MTDLVVGAPFHYAKDSGGAVYVYINSPNGFKQNHPFTKLTGERKVFTKLRSPEFSH
jgi:hypothetical protein